MREITFKTWDTKNKKWLDFIPPREYMLDSDEWNHVDDEDTLVYPASPLPTYNNRLVHCQFTGATDKDGNKIYNNDVISVHYFKNKTAPMVLLVRFHEELLTVLTWTKSLMFHLNTFYKNPDCEITVLGNYLEKPELCESYPTAK